MYIVYFYTNEFFAFDKLGFNGEEFSFSGHGRMVNKEEVIKIVTAHGYTVWERDAK